jgi:hypothetical protein
MPIMEIGSDIYGILATTTGTPFGQFQVEPDNGVDLWEWSSTPFPTTGFQFTAEANAGPISPTLAYADYAFSSNNEPPQQHWSGSTIFRLEMNGTVVGWLEVQSGSKPDLSWWSNGVDLNANRKLIMNLRDVLAFIPDSFPSDKLYPLDSVQTPL